MNQIPTSPANLPPMPGNLSSPPTLPEPPTVPNETPKIQIIKPGSQDQNTSGSSSVKILMAIIPLIVFSVTGLVSYSIVNNKQQALTYQSKAAGQTAAPTTVAKKTVLLNEASVSGCIFSLRYDASSASASLKDEAKTAIDKIKSRLAAGEKGEDILSEILNGPKIDTVKFDPKKPPINLLSTFQPADSPNLCFKTTKEVNDRLTIYFYQINPDFQAIFEKTNAQNLLNPFTIYKSIESGKIDYAWMIIQKE